MFLFADESFNQLLITGGPDDAAAGYQLSLVRSLHWA